MTVPYRLALITYDTQAWIYINGFVDVCFLLDIIIIFNKTIFDENFQIVIDRKIIAAQYIKGWFFVDVLAIIPFDMFFGGSDLNQVVRIARIGRMYKLIKLTRLIRVLKIIKEKSKFLQYMQQLFKISIGLQRLLGFLLAFFILIHICSCLWIMTATFMGDEGVDGTWMEGDIEELPHSEQYLTSFYFTVQTITTVGYGDMSISSNSEKIYCVMIMLVGVMSFSFFSGSLASIIQFYDC